MPSGERTKMVIGGPIFFKIVKTINADNAIFTTKRSENCQTSSSTANLETVNASTFDLTAVVLNLGDLERQPWLDGPSDIWKDMQQWFEGRYCLFLSQPTVSMSLHCVKRWLRTSSRQAIPTRATKTKRIVSVVLPSK